MNTDEYERCGVVWGGLVIMIWIVLAIVIALFGCAFAGDRA